MRWNKVKALYLILGTLLLVFGLLLLFLSPLWGIIVILGGVFVLHKRKQLVKNEKGQWVFGKATGTYGDESISKTFPEVKPEKLESNTEAVFQRKPSHTFVQEQETSSIMPMSINGIPLAYSYKSEGVAIVRGMEPDFSQLKPNMPVSFEPEPTNPYDPNAVIVKTGDIKIGYLFKGTRQEMTLDYIRRGDPIRAYIVEVDESSKRVRIAMGFYKQKTYKPDEEEEEFESLVRSKRPYKTFKLTGNRNEHMQDALSLCSEGEKVDYEYDYEKEKYLAICGDAIGYFPKSAEEYLEEEHPVFIETIEEDDDGKYYVEVAVFYDA